LTSWVTISFSNNILHHGLSTTPLPRNSGMMVNNALLGQILVKVNVSLFLSTTPWRRAEKNVKG